jgi:hypothetical protein
MIPVAGAQCISLESARYIAIRIRLKTEQGLTDNGLGPESLEAPGGFEPPRDGFAIRSLSHLGTAPFVLIKIR